VTAHPSGGRDPSRHRGGEAGAEAHCSLCVVVRFRRPWAAPAVSAVPQAAEALAEAGLLPVHSAKLFKHTGLRITEPLHNRGQNMHVVTQAGTSAVNRSNAGPRQARSTTGSLRSSLNAASPFRVILVLRSIQMIQFRHTRLAPPCAGHPRKPARPVPRLVDGRAKPGQDDWVDRMSGSEH
jgi:hypothetical protein